METEDRQRRNDTNYMMPDSFGELIGKTGAMSWKFHNYISGKITSEQYDKLKLNDITECLQSGKNPMKLLI